MFITCSIQRELKCIPGNSVPSCKEPLLGKETLVEAIFASDANKMPHANLVLNKDLIGETMIIQDRDNAEIDLDPNGAEGYEHLGSGWAARDAWPVIRTRRVTPLHLAARMGHFHIIKTFQRHGIPLDALDGEKYSILDYAKFGLDEFKDNYEFHLRGEFLGGYAASIYQRRNVEIHYSILD